MILTVFYIAATWMQSWRLSSIKQKISQYAFQQTSVLLHKVKKSKGATDEQSLSSSFCLNNDTAEEGDLLWDSTDRRACVLIPKQIVNVDNWIIFSDEDPIFPLPVARASPALKEPRLFVLVEALCLDLAMESPPPRCSLERIGVPRAWRTEENFGLIMESDIEHFSEFSSNFMFSRLGLDEGLEVTKVQTVDVEGRPCAINAGKVNVSPSPSRTLNFTSPRGSRGCLSREQSLQMSPTQWKSHVELLRNFSQYAEQVASTISSVPVPDRRNVTLTRSSRGKPKRGFTTPRRVAVETLPDNLIKITEAEKEYAISIRHLADGNYDGQAQIAAGLILVAEAITKPTALRLCSLNNRYKVYLLSAISLHSPTIIDIPEEEFRSPESTETKQLPSALATEMGSGESIVVTPEIRDLLSNREGMSPVKPTLAAKNEEIFLTTPSTRSETSSCQSTPGRTFHSARKNTFSSISSLNSLSSCRSGSSVRMKPPNVLVYSESPGTTDNVKAILNETLHRHKYTIYSVSKSQLSNSTWAVNCSLLVVCGNLPDGVEPQLVSFLLSGGRLFCMCSAFLHSLLPTFRTAEVRERELVRFTYGKWSRVRLMHHVFCYQNSPARTKFSREADEPPSEKDRVSPVPITPATVQVSDGEGRTHTLHVQVLGSEETWQTPSLLLAYFPSPGGRVVFSQVHLELDPSEISEEREGEALRSSDAARREIIRDILSSHLGLECGSGLKSDNQYTVAYFLGRHELKLGFLEKIRGKSEGRLGSMAVKLCGKGETPPPPTATLLPILIHSCPSNFSTLEYFETLRTESLGRLLIYCEVMSSSMDLVNGELAHGLTVVPSHQTSGKGRTGNQWLSPPGCCMFSQQLHFAADSYMGRHPSILQHAVALAVVSGLSDISPDYALALDLRLKWPNDIYTGDMVKVGGVLATCSVNDSTVVCNVGCGVNLDNDSPTTCLNSQVKEYNQKANQKVPKLTKEKLLALTFSRLEEILDRVQEGDVQFLHQLYYLYWLHGDAQVNVVGPGGSIQPVVVCGIDEYGFLRVREQTGRIYTVQPDGNSFDMMEGLILPKIC